MKPNRFRRHRTVVCLLIGVVAAMATGLVHAGSAARAPLSPARRAAVLQRLQEVQSRIETLQADFEEDRYMTALPVPLHYRGRLYYGRDGLFCMHYRDPVDYVMYVKDNRVILYIQGSPSADLVDIDSAGGAVDTRRLFAWDPETFRGEIREVPEGYRIEAAAPERIQNPSTPLIGVVLDSGTLLAKRIELNDDSGDRTEIRLSDVQVNQPLPDAVRNFQLPPDVTLNRLNPQ